MQHSGSGIVIPILKKTVYEYSFLTPGGASETIIIDDAAALPVAPYFVAQLLVRAHVVTMLSGQTVSVQALNTLPSAEDPAEFTDAATIISVDVISTTTAPGLVTPVSAINIGPFLKFQVVVTQGPTGGGELYAEISADLLLRLR